MTRMLLAAALGATLAASAPALAHDSSAELPPAGLGVKKIGPTPFEVRHKD